MYTVSTIAWRHVDTCRSNRGSNYMSSTLCGGSFAVAGHHPMVARLHCMARLRSPLSRFQKSRPRGKRGGGVKRGERQEREQSAIRGWAPVNALQMTSSSHTRRLFLLIVRRLFVSRDNGSFSASRV